MSAFSKSGDGKPDRPVLSVVSHDEAAPPDRRRVKPLEIIDPINWQGKPIPPRTWLADGLIPAGTVTILGGDGGVGKSLLGMQLVTACATGTDWLGRKIERCRALAIHCEDSHDEIQFRQACINTALGIDFDALEDVNLVSRVGEDNLLMGVDRFGKATGQRTPLYNQIRKAALDFGARLVLLDSLHDLFGGNENSRPEARSFVNLLRGLALDISGTVVLLSHPSLAGMTNGTGSSGSTAWNAAVRSRLYLTRQKEEIDPDIRELRVMKSNYGSLGQPIRLRWHDGIFINLDASKGIVASIERGRAERLFLILLDRTREACIWTSANSRSPNFAPRIFKKRTDAEGISEADFDRAMSALFTSMQIVNEDYGRPGDSHQRLVRRDGGGDPPPNDDE